MTFLRSVVLSRWFSFITSLILCFSSNSAKGQNNHYRDSLWQVVKFSKEDTGKIESYLKYGDLFKFSQPDSAVLFYEKARQLASQFHSKKGTTGYISHYIEVLNNKGEYTRALALCQQAVEINQQVGEPKDLVRAYNNLANEYQYLGALSSAAEYYLKATQIAENLPEKNYLKILTNNLSSVFFELEQFDKAYSYAATSNKIARELKDTQGIAFSLVNLGVSETHLGRKAEAMQHYREIISLGKYLNDYTLIADGYLNMAEINTGLNNIDLAIMQNQQALDLAKKNDNPNYKVLSLGGLADDYAARKEWTKANDYVQQAIAVAEQIQDRNNLNLLYNKASAIKEGLGDYKNALLYKNKFEHLNDSLLNEKTRNHINDLETRYQTVKKDNAIAEQQLQLENTKAVVRTRNMQIWLLAIGIALLLVFSLLIIRLYRQRQKLNRQMLLSLQKEQEVNVLKAVLEGQEHERQRIAREMHDDMGSGLTSILYLCRELNHTKAENDTVVRKIAATAHTLTGKMNEIIWSMNQEYDTLEDLVAYIRHHAAEMLETTSLAYSLHSPDEIPAMTLSGKARRNIYLVVKEALHNAVKHAHADCVSIDIRVNGDLYISVQDNGRGMLRDSGRKFGNGLRNMQERMNSIGGTFQILSSKGTRVELILPLSKNELPA